MAMPETEVLSIADAQQSNLIATASVPQYDVYHRFVSIDVTFLLSLGNDYDQFAGFMFRLPIEPEFPEQQGLQFVNPMLQIDFTPTSLPAALPLFATGLRRVGSAQLAQEAEGCSSRSLIASPDRISEARPRWRFSFCVASSRYCT